MKLLSDEIISLSALEPSDIETLYEWENLSELWNTSATLAPYSRRNLARYIENYDANPFTAGELRLMARLVSTGQPVGFVDLYGVEVRHRRAFIGILVAPSCQRCGYATRILALLERYSSRHLNLHQLLAVVPDYNIPSKSLFAKAGFSHVATLPDFICLHRDFADASLMHKLL